MPSARAETPKDTLLVLVENGPNSLDIHGVGTIFRSYVACWNPYDRLLTRIQMVFQDAGESLNPRFTAFQAIADRLRRLTRLRGPRLAARVHEAAGLAGLPDELLGRFPLQLSGGQKARVGIARAIAVEPGY